MDHLGGKEGRSLVNYYELALLEINHSSQNGKSAELYKCFQMFDELIPMLGKYKRVMKMIRDNIYEAVFSREYTVDTPIMPQHSHSSDSTTSMQTRNETDKISSIERIPHFEILNKVVDERNYRADAAERQVTQLNCALEEKNNEIRSLGENTERLESMIARQKQNIEELQRKLVSKENENNSLDNELRYQKEKLRRKVEEFKECEENLHEQLKEEASRISELNRFKQCHEKVQEHFRDPSIFTPSRPDRPFSAKEQKLRKDITEGHSLQKQLLSLRNTCIDEYDEHLEEYNCLKENINDNTGCLLGGRANEEDHSKRVAAFAGMISNIENEIAQNVTHLSILEKNLDEIKERKRKQNEYAFDAKENAMENSELLDVIKECSMKQTFVSQEQLLSKYSVIVLYSCNQGKTFQELPGVQHCRSCGIKTLVCPHKATSEETVFHLPLQCTHIMFQRPKLHVAHFSSDSGRETSSSANERASQNVHEKLWNDLTTREIKSLQRIPRILKMEFIVSLIEQFYASVISEDLSQKDEKIMSILDVWYEFLKSRYECENVGTLVARDVLETIQNSSQPQLYVQLFLDCLCGILDPAAFRYYLIVRRFVCVVVWRSLRDFTLFASVIYPFMDVDDLEQITMSFRAHGKNIIDEKRVCDFFLSMILKSREPAFHDMENQLLSRPGVGAGVMMDGAFFEAIAEISPSTSEQLCGHLYMQSKVAMEPNTSHVSIARLSQIGSYLVLYQQASLMETRIRTELQTK